MKRKERLEKSIKSNCTNMASLPKMRGRTRIARKLLASILKQIDQVTRLESLDDTLSEDIEQLEEAGRKIG